MKKSLLFLLVSGLAFASALGSDSLPSEAMPPPATQPEYIALGDSLAEGVGASDPLTTAYVPLFHNFLTRALPADTLRRAVPIDNPRNAMPPDNQRAAVSAKNLVLTNLGHGGDTSSTLISHDHLAAAVAELEARNGDKKPSNDVRVITLDIGGNDLFAVLPVCSGGLTPTCVTAISTTFATFSANFNFILGELRTAAGPDTPIIVMTYYNPLVNPACPFNALAPLGDIALEGDPALGLPQGLNDLIRSIAAIQGAEVADTFGLLAPADLQPDCLHANDSGYAIIAGEFAEAFED